MVREIGEKSFRGFSRGGEIDPYSPFCAALYLPRLSRGAREVETDRVTTRSGQVAPRRASSRRRERRFSTRSRTVRAPTVSLRRGLATRLVFIESSRSAPNLRDCLGLFGPLRASLREAAGAVCVVEAEDSRLGKRLAGLSGRRDQGAETSERSNGATGQAMPRVDKSAMAQRAGAAPLPPATAVPTTAVPTTTTGACANDFFSTLTRVWVKFEVN